jgi:hypothetical protein
MKIIDIPDALRMTSELVGGIEIETAGNLSHSTRTSALQIQPLAPVRRSLRRRPSRRAEARRTGGLEIEGIVPVW